MIVWSGLGILVVPVVIASSLLVQLAAALLLGSGDWSEHQWPVAIILLLSAVGCWKLGQWLDGREARVLIDAATGERVVLRPSHTLFFMPVRWWPFILAGLSLTALVLEFTR